MATRRMEVEMDALATMPIIVVYRVVPEQATCYLCGAPLADTGTGLLCLVCQAEEDAKWHDYLAERAAQRWPI